MIGLRHQALIAQALTELLGPPIRGTVAFVRCLTSDQIDALVDAWGVAVPGWTVLAVIDAPGARRITTDQAVEWREDKGEPVLFLVDPLRAGAGLDGIYSAAREIGEAALFAQAHRCAQAPLKHLGRLPDRVISRARGLGRRQQLTPWQIFDFLVAAETQPFGQAISRLGLWPMAAETPPSDAELDLAVQMSDRLLYLHDSRGMAERVRGLLLEGGATAAAPLERFLRDHGDRAPLATLAALDVRPELWLGPLVPRFSGNVLTGIRLVPWRDPKGRLMKWPGLIESEDVGAPLRFVLDRNAAAKDQAKLTLRWTTQPEEIARGSVSYRVALLSGAEVLTEKTVEHKEKSPQQAVFALADFEDLDDAAKYEAHVEISVIGLSDLPTLESEEFLFEFGTNGGPKAASTGRVYRCLVDGAIQITSRERFDAAVERGHLAPRCGIDKAGVLSWKGEAATRAVRVLRPDLIARVEADWQARQGAIGHWVQRVRGDGMPVGGLAFQPIDFDATPTGDRVRDAARKLAQDLGEFGLLARVLSAKWPALEGYLAAWQAALDAGDPMLAWHGTVEVQSLSGQFLGLIVTPLHPLRLAWSRLYDQVAVQARYDQGLSAIEVQRELSQLDSAHFPAILPGKSGRLVFADTLGFHAAAMTAETDREPKATVALLAECLGGGQAIAAPTIGSETAAVLAREIRHYRDCQSDRLDLVTLQAWRPGDGATIARALGRVIDEQPGEEDDAANAELCFALDLYQPHTSTTSGQFLVNIGRRRRTHAAGLDRLDRWMTTTAPRPGGLTLPRFRWTRQPEPQTDADWATTRAAHLGLIFDIFDVQSRLVPETEGAEPRPRHVYGLTKAFERRVQYQPEPEWSTSAPQKLVGPTAPGNKPGGERLRKIDRAVMRLAARQLGATASGWPGLTSSLPPASRARIEHLHALCDWVVTIDRNAGLEYFDSPLEFPEVYQRFVIDAVPERADLGALQLVTSTANLDAVRDLIDEALAAMALPGNLRTTQFLVESLKALSGRLAIRLANDQGRTAELIALALLQANCDQAAPQAPGWMTLREGFFVPVAEIADQIGPWAAEPEVDRQPQFLHVSVQPKGALEFRFVEVRHRLHLRTARDPEFLAAMRGRTTALRLDWMQWLFGEGLKPLQRAIRRSKLARILTFYADRARRHQPSVHLDRLRAEIDQLVLREDYQPAGIAQPEIGYVFCPELRSGEAEPLYPPGNDACAFWLFGPAILTGATRPLVEDPATPPRPEPTAPPQEVAIADDPDPAARPAPSAPVPEPIGAAEILLGDRLPGGTPVTWPLSVKSNPHLMVVGLPGMGKTTALINICTQLSAAGITPIVFSYHDDIDEKLDAVLGQMLRVDFDGLGFNPLAVAAPEPKAHVDVAGTVRDIFGAVFSDLGDLQLEDLRQAIMQTYDSYGWGARKPGEAPPAPPPFRAFFDVLTAKPKPNLTLLARLRELADYGFFDNTLTRPSLLSSTQATVIRVHRTTNGILQNAFASFVLYSLYSDMFRRGVQSRLTHAIVIDEAHRAARLKLIPRFAKECRKFGLSLILASQGARDFDPALFEAVGSTLMLRVTEADARALARNTVNTSDQARVTDQLKSLQPYTAFFSSLGSPRPAHVKLRGD